MAGFVLAAAARVARRHWTMTQMFMLVGALTIGYGAIMVNWGRGHARSAELTVALEPEPATAFSLLI